MIGISRRDIMPISRSDRESQTNRIADLKEEYDTRETQTVKKKNAEIKRNQKKHDEELKDTREAYESRINDMQGKFYERLSERDRDHQKKIEDVRGVYVSQMRKKMEDSQGEKARLTETYESEKGHQNKITESQKNVLREKFQDEIQSRDEKISDLHQSSRKNLQETLADRAGKMNASHEKDKNVLMAGSQEDKQKAADEKKQLKRFYSNELEGQKKDKARMQENADNRYMTTVQTMKAEHSDDIQTRNELLQNEVNRTRNRFEEKYNQLEDKMIGQGDSFRENIDERYNSQVRSKDSEIYRLKNRMYVDQVNQKKRDGLEKEHIVNDYEKKIGIYEQNMNDQRGVFKDINDKHISKLSERHSDVLQETTLKSRLSQNLSNEKHRQDRAAIMEQQKNDMFNTKSSAEKRVETIQKLANDRETKLVSYYDEYLDLMKEGYLEKIFEQREKHDKDLSALNDLMGDKFRKLKQTYEQRLDRTTRGFEEKMAKVKDEHAREVKTLAKVNDTTIADKNKSVEITRNEVEDKYENKMKTMQEQYRAEMDRMNDRHQEDLRSLSTKMQNYSRKA